MTAADTLAGHPDSMLDPRPHLSKTRYLKGLQCPKQLWLSVHARALTTPPSPAQQAIFEMGHRVGRRAHELFPGGVEVHDPARRHRAAVAQTRRLLADPDVPAIFEAVFEYVGVRIHVDALERLPDGAFGLREVKGSAAVKEEHRHDVAVQRWVLEGSGIELGSAELVHVNRAYVRGPGAMDVRGFFQRVELRDALAREASQVPARVEALHRVLARREAPPVEPGPHCHKPHACPFWEHCTRGKPRDWIFHLPRGNAHFASLQEEGIESISEIPDHFPLSVAQRRVRDAHRSGLPFVSSQLACVLEKLGPPALSLDFETLAPAEPLFAGTHPFESLAFQWSLHRMDEAGDLVHQEFLAAGRGDPRRPVAESLLAAVGADDTPLLVWSSAENSVLTSLAERLPDLAPALLAVRARLVDLLAIVKEHVYLPAFEGSYSLKAVAPALVPGFGWSDLAESTGVAEGGSASDAFGRCLRGQADALEEARIRAALRVYCGRDTEAVVRVHAALRKLVERSPRESDTDP